MRLYERQESLQLDVSPTLSIVGCGGVGYWVAKFAAMSGIEKLYLFDPDVIEEHNLNRLDLPEEVLGVNKAQVTRNEIVKIRPFITVIAIPFVLQEHTFIKTDWLVDCTDNIKSQELNQTIARKFGSKYVKAGYNGLSITISNSVAEWGEAPDGYTVIPSWVVPATVVAALTVGKILKYKEHEVAGLIETFYYKM